MTSVMPKVDDIAAGLYGAGEPGSHSVSREQVILLVRAVRQLGTAGIYLDPEALNMAADALDQLKGESIRSALLRSLARTARAIDSEVLELIGLPS